MSVITLSGAGRSLLIWEDNGGSPTAVIRDLVALFDGHEWFWFRAGVVGRRADDFPVLPLLDHMSAPAGGSGNDEKRGEEVNWDAHEVVGDGAIPVEIREHAFGIVHGGFNALGDVEEPHVLC